MRWKLIERVLWVLTIRKGQSSFSWEPVAPVDDNVLRDPVFWFRSHMRALQQMPNWKDRIQCSKSGFHSVWRSCDASLGFPAVGAQTLSNAVKDLMCTCAVDVSYFKAASVRGAAATHFLNVGVDASAVQNRGRWMHSYVFQRHYARNSTSINWSKMVEQGETLNRPSWSRELERDITELKRAVALATDCSVQAMKNQQKILSALSPSNSVATTARKPLIENRIDDVSVVAPNNEHGPTYHDERSGYKDHGVGATTETTVVSSYKKTGDFNKFRYKRKADAMSVPSVPFVSFTGPGSGRGPVRGRSVKRGGRSVSTGRGFTKSAARAASVAFPVDSKRPRSTTKRRAVSSPPGSH